MIVCEKCGKPVRYIAAASLNGIFMVDLVKQELISEKGRIITGYKEHKCKEDKENGK
jgi:hypothetical protein